VVRLARARHRQTGARRHRARETGSQTALFFLLSSLGCWQFCVRRAPESCGLEPSTIAARGLYFFYCDVGPSISRLISLRCSAQLPVAAFHRGAGLVIHPPRGPSSCTARGPAMPCIYFWVQTSSQRPPRKYRRRASTCLCGIWTQGQPGRGHGATQRVPRSTQPSRSERGIQTQSLSGQKISRLRRFGSRAAVDCAGAL